MAPPSEAKRRRRWAPKVRSGCRTCNRIRKKKCDEGKPHCSRSRHPPRYPYRSCADIVIRCISDQYTCDGYDQPKAWIFEPSRERHTKRFAPRSDSLEASVSRPVDSVTVEGFDTESAILPAPSRHQVDFPLEPSSPWSSSVDQVYTRYFLFEVAPLVSTTRKWQYFWQSTVPQAAWATPSIQHAMIAVAATYESSISGYNHDELITRRTKQAIHAFTTDATPSSWDTALIVCRLFSSMAQCNEDWRTATMHMANGVKILREAAANTGQRRAVSRSEIVRLMAPTLLGQASFDDVSVTASDNEDDHDDEDPTPPTASSSCSAATRFPPSKRRMFRDLKAMASAYARILRATTQPCQRDQLPPGTLGLLSVASSMVNQALASALDPDVLFFHADDGDPITPAAQVQRDLLASGTLMTSLSDLKISSTSLFNDMRMHMHPHGPPLTRTSRRALGLDYRLRMFVDNFVVHAWYLEPRMTAGTFWLPSPSPQDEGQEEWEQPFSGCAIDRVRQLHRTTTTTTTSLGGGSARIMPEVEADDAGSRRIIDDDDDPIVRERRRFFLEHVCQYRSGFMC